MDLLVMGGAILAWYVGDTITTIEMIEHGSEKLESNPTVRWFYEGNGYEGIFQIKTAGTAALLALWAGVRVSVSRYSLPGWLPVLIPLPALLLGAYATWTNAGLIGQTYHPHVTAGGILIEISVWLLNELAPIIILTSLPIYFYVLIDNYNV